MKGPCSTHTDPIVLGSDRVQYHQDRDRGWAWGGQNVYDLHCYGGSRHGMLKATRPLALEVPTPGTCLVWWGDRVGQRGNNTMITMRPSGRGTPER